MIWDLHCHLSGATLSGKTPEERLEHLISISDRFRIERLCVYMGMRFEDNPTPDKFRSDNDEVMRAIEKYPERAFGFVYLNPKYVEESLAELDRCVARGPMVGVKLWVARRASVPELDPIIRRAAELKAVIFQHTWFNIAKGIHDRPGESTPDDFVQLAERHPTVPIICGHTGGDWELGLRAVRHLKNVYVDLAGFDPVAGCTEMAVRELGAARVLYGSDAPGRSFASQLGKVYGADLPESSKRLILGENLKKLLLPILREKGITP